jgi:leader peptidase (prepilin peptidase)/N-methyltransferase
MTIFLYATIFLIGTFFGSFFTLAIYRIPKKEDILIKHSYCPNCNHKLGFFDLFPILSYIFLLGKCRYCGNKISIQYLFIELLSGCLGILCYYRYGFNMNWILHFLVIELCITISFIDIKTMIIPDELNIIIFILGLIRIFYYDLNLFEYILYSIGVPIIFMILNKFYIDCIGGGDIKFMFSIAFLLGKRIYISFFLGVFSASIYALYLLIIKKYHRKSRFAFGPFLSLGNIVAILYGNKLLRVYSSLIL